MAVAFCKRGSGEVHMQNHIPITVLLALTFPVLLNMLLLQNVTASAVS